MGTNQKGWPFTDPEPNEVGPTPLYMFDSELIANLIDLVSDHGIVTVREALDRVVQ